MATASAPNGPEIDPAAMTHAEWGQLCELMNGYIYSQTLATACDVDLFTFLAHHPGSRVEDVAAGLKLSSYATRVLMLACCAIGIVLRDDESGVYSNSPLASRVLVAGTPSSMVDFIRFNHLVQQRCSTHLTTALGEGRNAGLDEFPGPGTTLYERLTAYPQLESLFQRAMGAYTRSSPRMLQLREFGDIRQLLDVGGGDGSNAIRLCVQHPALAVTVVDLPSVVPIAQQQIEQRGLGERIRCRSLDMFADAWPRGHDGILLSHIVEIFSPHKIVGLYRRAYEALPPGGRLFVWTIMASDSETSGLQAAKSSIYFLSTASGEGMAYPARDHDRWLREVGFSTIVRYDARTIDHGALVACK
jgi:methyltransferase